MTINNKLATSSADNFVETHYIVFKTLAESTSVIDQPCRMTRNSCHSVLALTFIGRRRNSPQMQNLKTVPFSSSKQSLDVQISTLNLPPGSAVPIRRHRLTQKTGFCVGGAWDAGLLSCLWTLNILIHHLNQYGAVLHPKSELRMRTDTQTKLI